MTSVCRCPSWRLGLLGGLRSFFAVPRQLDNFGGGFGRPAAIFDDAVVNGCAYQIALDDTVKYRMERDTLKAENARLTDILRSLSKCDCTKCRIDKCDFCGIATEALKGGSDELS